MLPTAPFGSTGHRSTRVIFGAAALGGMSQNGPTRRSPRSTPPASITSTPPLATAPAKTASSRSSPTTVTDSSSRPRPASGRATPQRAQLERSLERMGVDHVDLIQLHNLVEPDEWESAFASGGAVEALTGARDEGLTRFIGVTGHGLRIASMHLRAWPHTSSTACCSCTTTR
ncbi:MAG: aldo/keto reductase [Ilumatobacteraceae bacterium]